MKKNFFYAVMLLAVVCPFFAAQAQQKYTIEGKISGLKKPMKVIMAYWPSKTEQVKDSAIITNGVFHMKGVLTRPYMVNMYVTSIIPVPQPTPHIGDIMPAIDAQSFYLAPGKNTITGKTLTDAVVDNPVQKEYLAHQNVLKPLTNKIGPVNLKIYESKNKDSIAKYTAEREELLKPCAQADIDFVKTHPNSYVAFDLVKSYGIVITDAKAFEQLYNALSPGFKNTPEGKHMAEDLYSVKQLGIGQQAMNFTQADVNGKPVSLASLKGKYVLVDFWASWCGPCRMEYPFLHKAYDQFKDKGFEIIGVSIDDKKELWVNSIAENKFQWIEVSDLKGRQNAVARLYGISAIPQSFLLDPNGVIIAKNLRGEDLIEKLTEVIKTDK